MSDLRLADYAAVTFDVYGTVIDWEPEILAFLQRWTRDAGLALTDAVLLESYDRLRQPIQEERPAWPYPEVLMRTLDGLAAELDCELPGPLREVFGGIAATHTPFPDSREAIDGLRRRGLVLGALSNIDDASFATLRKRTGLDFDVVVTAQRVGSYKPDRGHFLAALSDLRARGIEQSAVLHVAQSKRADVVPATELGLTCVWVDRPGHVFGRRGGGAESANASYRITSLAELLNY